MTDELLPYYEKELTFFKQLGADFARRHSRTAARLQLEDGYSTDPHVERMIQAFAFLNARIRFKLDDDFPELTDALLGVLYPHLTRPTPSFSIVEFALDSGQAGLTNGYSIPRGTPLDLPTTRDGPCHFRTAFDVTLWPFRLDDAKFLQRPFPAPPTRSALSAEAALSLRLSPFDPATPVTETEASTLRLCLHAPGTQLDYQLYELLMNNVVDVVLVSADRPNDPVPLRKDCVRPVGFAADESLFPTNARQFPGYLLLSEYFAFPQKFLFVDLVGVDFRRLPPSKDVEVWFLLNRGSDDLEQNVNEDVVRVGCTPIVNLFSQVADPVNLDEYQTEYRIVPDSRREGEMEIYSIDRVSANLGGEVSEVAPFYSFKHASEQSAQSMFWHASRRSAGQLANRPPDDAGTEMMLTFVDLGFSPTRLGRGKLSVDTTCVNRDMPRWIDISDPAKIRMPDGRGPVASNIHCLIKPTPTRRPDRGQRAYWQLISQLSLNHLSISDGDAGADALREIIVLYDQHSSRESRATVDSLKSVECTRVVRRAGGLNGGFCRGLQVAIDFDEDQFGGRGLYLFASILERFLPMYASINSFTQLVAMTEERSRQGDEWRWPPRTGARDLL